MSSQVLIFAVAVFVAWARAVVRAEQPTSEPPLVFSQPPDRVQGGWGDADGSVVLHADDFSFASSTTIPVIAWWGIESRQGTSGQFNLKIYSDQSGEPGTVLLDLTPAQIDKVYVQNDPGNMGSIFRYSITLEAPFVVGAGQQYWLSIASPPSYSWGWWISSSSGPGSVATYQLNGGPWITSQNWDYAFSLGAVPEPSTAILLGGGGVLLFLARRRQN